MDGFAKGVAALGAQLVGGFLCLDSSAFSHSTHSLLLVSWPRALARCTEYSALTRQARERRMDELYLQHPSFDDYGRRTQGTTPGTGQGQGTAAGLRHSPLCTSHGTEALGTLELVGKVHPSTELTLEFEGSALLFGFCKVWK